MEKEPPQRVNLVVMGVAGCGKSTIGRVLAERLDTAYIEGDRFHPKANIEKMSRGIPLTDTDRAPWITAVGAAIAAKKGPSVTSCSALRRLYRQWLRDTAGGELLFVHLAGRPDLIAQRMANRTGHFMPLSLIDSQFETLEPPGADENAITVTIDQDRDALLADILRRLTGHFP